MERGYTLVRPLAGGLDAWMAAGYGVEADPLLEAGGVSGAAART
jgi:3-mercaptopyruvate sulfurtransferase SseA